MVEAGRAGVGESIEVVVTVASGTGDTGAETGGSATKVEIRTSCNFCVMCLYVSECVYV